MSGDNGKIPRIDIINERIKELEPRKEEADARKELGKLYAEKNSIEKPNDYKIAEIWIKEGSIMLDASPQFWTDKLRALGLLEMCKDIVKELRGSV